MLVLVLGVILVVIALTSIVMSTMLSQSRLTKHQVDRSKAYYAAQSGINFALEMMRQGKWNNANCGSVCTICNNLALGCNITDTDMPFARINITIGPEATGIQGTTPLNATVDYTYTP